MLFRYMYMPTNMADGVSNKVEIKTGKGEIPVKYCYDEKSQLKEMEKENYQNSPDTDKTKLHGELLEQCQHELQTVREKLRKTEDELEESNNCNRELRDEVDKLNTQLRQLKNATKDKSDAESQTDASLLHGDIDGFKYLDGLSKDQAIVINDSVDEGHEHQTVEDTKLAKGGDTESAETHGDKETDMGAATKESATVKSNGESKDNDIKMESDDKKEKEDKQEEGSSVSLADELRATAEAVVQQTGYVYDENSGLYYDYNSGYYYNAEKALYYDPKTGTYFYYNSESGKYEFHSQVDVSQYSTTQGYNYNYSQNRDHYPRGGNYDTPPQRDYYSSHRDSGYDQHHRVLPRRDRDTPRSSSKSYIDHHTSHRSDRRDNDKKKKSKRLQAEEMEYRKRKKKRKDKDKKKKKRKSSKEKRRDKSQERKGDEKCSDKKKDKRNRKKSEEGEVLSEDSNEKDDKSKEDDDDKTDDEDLANYDLVGDSRSYMDELYESFDENSNDVTSEETSTVDDLYDDLGDDIVQKCESEDDDSSKNDVKSSDHKSSENDIPEMELSLNTDNVNTETNFKKAEYSKEKSRTRESSSKTDEKNKRAGEKSHHNVKDKHKILHKDVVSTSDEHRTKKSRTETSNKDKQSSDSNSKSSKYHGKYRESRNPNTDFSKTSSEKPHSKSGKEDRTYSAGRSQSSRKAKSRSHRKSSPSSSDSESDSSNSVCTGESELESGEITSSSDEEVAREEPVAMHCDDDIEGVEDVPELYGEGHTNDVIMADEEMVSKWPPCIRMIVTDSDIIDPGTLFIVTCTGATVGREKEMGHTILIPDINISKAHAEIHFDEAEYQYFLIDLASQNGTFLNEERISEPKVKSKPKALGHGDTLQFGCTRLLLHIHEGMDTCDECEPGQVQAQLQAQNQQPKEIVILSKEEKLRQQKQQLKKIKKKYGLKNSAYEDNMSAINNSSYSDKAEERRKTVGSDNPYQPDEAPASVHRPISEDNKGHKMLKKLGWSEGESLGKDNEGIRQPISVKFRANKSAGLGAGGAGEGSVEAVGDLHRRQKWLEVQQRYNQMEVDKTTANKSDKKTLTAPKWVQGETQEG